MNNGIEIKSYSDYESVINSFEQVLNNITDIFDKQDNEMKKINKTEVWTSITQEELCNKYNELSKQYEGIKLSLENYINFMKNTLNNYKEAEKSLNNSLNQNTDNLDVN